MYGWCGIALADDADAADFCVRIRDVIIRVTHIYGKSAFSAFSAREFYRGVSRRGRRYFACSEGMG